MPDDTRDIKAWNVLASGRNSQRPSRNLENPTPTRAVAARLCFTERGSNSKMISEEEITCCWKVLCREKTAQSTLMKVRWKRNSPQELTSWCAIIMPA